MCRCGRTCSTAPRSVQTGIEGRIVGWLRKLFSNDDSSGVRSARASTQQRKVYISGDPPVPPLHMRPRSADYARHDGSRGRVDGFELRAESGELLYDNRCGVTRWPHLGLYRPEVVGESFRDARSQRSACRRPGAAGPGA